MATWVAITLGGTRKNKKEIGLENITQKMKQILAPWEDRLNTIDAEAKDGVYRYLPVVVYVLWTTKDRATRELRLTAILRDGS